MKIMVIAIKDFVQSSRSLVSIGMMIVAPLLITGLVSLAFGGMSTGSDPQPAEFILSVANLDQGSTPAPTAGDQLLAFLQSDQAPAWLTVQTTTGEDAARQAVRDQQAGAALVIPAGLTQAIHNPAQPVEIPLLSDLPESYGVLVTENLVGQYLKNLTQFDLLAQQVNSADRASAIQQYQQYQANLDTRLASQDPSLLLVQKTGAQSKDASATTTDPLANILRQIMAGMLVFFVFFTGANGAISILREEEQQTMPRLLTSPTAPMQILAGKFLSIWFTILVQIGVLLTASSLMFHIRWGNPAALCLVSFGLSVAATGFGIFLLTFASNTRQAGVLTGGILSALGMLGGLFTAAISTMPAAFRMVSLFTPQGWAMRAFTQMMNAEPISLILVSAAATVGFGLAAFFAGLVRFQRRLQTH